MVYTLVMNKGYWFAYPILASFKWQWNDIVQQPMILFQWSPSSRWRRIIELNWRPVKVVNENKFLKNLKEKKEAVCSFIFDNKTKSLSPSKSVDVNSRIAIFSKKPVC